MSLQIYLFIFISFIREQTVIEFSSSPFRVGFTTNPAFRLGIQPRMPGTRVNPLTTRQRGVSIQCRTMVTFIVTQWLVKETKVIYIYLVPRRID